MASDIHSVQAIPSGLPWLKEQQETPGWSMSSRRPCRQPVGGNWDIQTRQLNLPRVDIDDENEVLGAGGGLRAPDCRCNQDRLAILEHSCYPITRMIDDWLFTKGGDQREGWLCHGGAFEDRIPRSK